MRRIHRPIGIAGTAILLVALASLSPAASAPSTDDGDELLPDLEAVGAYWSTEAPRTIVLDPGRPEAQEAVMSVAAELDDVTIQVEGIQVLSSEQRREVDAAAPGLSSSEREALDALGRRCPPEPSGPRGANVVPYLGCEPANGPILGTSVGSSIPNALALAAAQILGQWIAITADQIHVSSEPDGRYTVDFDPEVGRELTELGFGPGSEILTYLEFTGYSNSKIRQITFSVGGDCLAFHVAIDGDMCGPLTFSSK